MLQKRKAQNRAAQRAFRERKEKHLKDLETKVEDLEKASESANHENGLLRAQVTRLQTELKEYRKRLSLNNNAVNRGSPTSQFVGQPFSSKANWDINNNFQFEFPKFGPHTLSSIAQIKQRSSTGNFKANTNNIPRNSSFTSSSPRTTVGPSRNTSVPLPPAFPDSGMDELSTLFSPEILASVNRRNNSDYLGSHQPEKFTQQGSEKGGEGAASRKGSSTARSVTDSNSASPASSGDNGGFVSSCATTPESSAESPEQRKASEPALGLMNGGAQKTNAGTNEVFGKDSSFARRVNGHAITKGSDNASTSIGFPQAANPELDFSGFDWLASQNGGAFDPVLFGDYRDPQENIMNNDYGFFNDALGMPELASPMNQPLEPALPKKKDLMQEIEDQQAGKEPEVTPSKGGQQFLTCNLLWSAPTPLPFSHHSLSSRDRVQKSEKFQNGEADMDDLCSQLKSKAKCSGSGAVIAQSDVDRILGPAPKNQNDALRMFK